MAGRAYVPPHLRNRPHPTSAQSSSSHPPTSVKADTSSLRTQSSDRASNSRTPWSRATPASSSRQPPSTFNVHPSRPGSSASVSASASNWPAYDEASSSTSSSFAVGVGRSSSGPGRPRMTPGGTGSPTLYVFGDSFVGPMKLLSDDCCRPTTYKGASAKGLNNPNSAKQVAKMLLPALEDLLAPPPYRYVPSSGRWALLVFGNVDLQINYLWQLQHKPLSHLSFPSTASASASAPSSSSPPSSPKLHTLASAPSATNNASESDTETSDDPTSTSSAAQRSVLARATETSLSGPALGPDLFVQAVIKAYTGWLEREIVNGPIGERVRAAATRRKDWEDGGRKGGRASPPGKILIAAALPPLVEDEILPRIPEKYVERLEEDHEKAQKLLDSDQKSSWREFKERQREEGTEGIQDGLAMVGISDRPGTPSTATSTSSASPPDTAGALGSMRSSRSSVAEQDALVDNKGVSAITDSGDNSASSPSPTSTKTSIESLLSHNPPLCTLAIRVNMTNTYNTLLSSFCSLHSDVFSFIDISPRMREIDSQSGWPIGIAGEVDRGTWACPVDPTNVHPLWEPTLPLWLEAMGREGLPVDGYTMQEGAEETFRAYEADKRRRTKERSEREGGQVGVEEGAAGGGEERLKLRDE